MAHGEGREGAGRAEHYMRGRDRYMERGQRIEKESLSPGCHGGRRNSYEIQGRIL